MYGLGLDRSSTFSVTVYLVFRTWQRTKTKKYARLESFQVKLSQKSVSLSLWVSPAVVPLRQCRHKQAERGNKREDTEPARACGSLRGPLSLERTS